MRAYTAWVIDAKLEPGNYFAASPKPRRITKRLNEALQLARRSDARKLIALMGLVNARPVEKTFG